MKLWFQDYDGDEEFVGTAKNDAQIGKLMDKKLAEIGMTRSPYERHWDSDGRIWIDFGSHDCFFFIDNGRKCKTM